MCLSVLKLCQVKSSHVYLGRVAPWATGWCQMGPCILGVVVVLLKLLSNVQWQRLISKVDTKDKPLRFTLFKILELGHLTLLFFRWRVRNMPRLKRACVVTSLVSPCFAKAPYFNPRCYHQGVCFTHPGSKNILDKQTLIFRDEPKKGWFFSSRATCDSLRWAKRKKLFSPVYAWHWLKWI